MGEDDGLAVIAFTLLIMVFVFSLVSGPRRTWRCKHCLIPGTKEHVESTGTHHHDDCPRRLWRCKHCLIPGTKEHVESTGTHHHDDCPRRLWKCRYCLIPGTKEHVESRGTHHHDDCPRRLWHCRYRPIFGTEEHVVSKGTHHHDDCPRRLWKCSGCDLHSAGALLDETASGGIWNAWECQEAEASVTRRMSPDRLKFCQNSISTQFHDGTSVFARRLGLGRAIPKVLACFHEEPDGARLFALNNRTLFNAIFNDVGEVIVTVVEKPSDWHRRFTGKRPWMCMQVRQRSFLSSASFVKIPAESFPFPQTPSRCWLVLEARNLVNPKKTTLYELLADMCPDLKIQRCVGERDYARVRVIEEDKPLVRSAIKALAKKLGKRPNDVDCKEVPGERLFDSPRD